MLLVLREQLDSKVLSLEAYRMRIAQLESLVTQSEEALVVQKRRLNEVREECHAIVEVRLLLVLRFNVLFKKYIF